MKPDFYKVNVNLTRLGGGDHPVDYYYRTRKEAEDHIDRYRQETLRDRNDYRIIEDTGTKLLLRTESWSECTLRLYECYFED